MALPKLPFGRYITSRQLISGAHINALTDLLTGTATGITATAGGTAANSLQLSSAFNEITTVAANNDSVVLPAAKSGLRVFVLNSAVANSLRVFAYGTDTIKGAASIDLAGGASTAIMLVCVKDGLWRSFAAT